MSTEQTAGSGAGTGNTALFYGSVPITLAAVGGTTYGFDPVALSESNTDAAVAAAREREAPLSGLGPGYATLVVPAIPAPDIALDSGAESLSELSRVLPQQLHTPLLKIPADPRTAGARPLSGVASGIRSGLVCVDGAWYRLKGCGNNDEGFVVAPVDTDAGRAAGLVNIRGSSFVHTSLRELLFTERASQAAASIGMLSANTPLGWYEYESGDNCEFPKVTRACSVFATRGDKRLGDHVLVGLERMMGSLLSEGTAAAALAALAANGRASSESDPGSVTPTFIQALMGASGFVPAVGPEWDARLDPVDVVGEARAAALAQLVDGLVEELGDDAAAVDVDVSALAGAAGPGLGKLYGYLYWRFGWECGAFLRALHAASISWGTYPDAMGMHCNAHSNNMVILPASEHINSPGSFFLAPLDFDMAYSAESHLFDAPDAMAEYLILERNGMLMALAGDDQISTGVTGSAAIDPAYAPLAVLLRDTAAAGFCAAYPGPNAATTAATDAAPYDPALTDAAYVLIRLALYHTMRDIA